MVQAIFLLASLAIVACDASPNFEELKSSNGGSGPCRFSNDPNKVPDNHVDFTAHRNCYAECCRRRCEERQDCTAYEVHLKKFNGYAQCEVYTGDMIVKDAWNSIQCFKKLPHSTLPATAMSTTTTKPTITTKTSAKSTTTTTTTTTSKTTTTTTGTTTTNRLQVNDKCDPIADACDAANNLVCSPNANECRYIPTAVAEIDGTTDPNSSSETDKVTSEEVTESPAESPESPESRPGETGTEVQNGSPDGPGASASNTEPGINTGSNVPQSDSTAAIVGGVLGFLILVVIIFLIVRTQTGKTATLPGEHRQGTTNPMYDFKHGALANDNADTPAGKLPSTLGRAELEQGSAYATVDDEPTNVAAPTSFANGIEADYANPDQLMAAAVSLAGGTKGGNGMVDENNVYDMQTPGRRRTNSSSGSRSNPAAGRARAQSHSKGTRCTRPSPSGGVCKNMALKATLFCKGHTCPIQGCTSSKSTKMETCPEHVHAQAKRRGGARSVQPRPESGEVFYDSFGAAGVNSGAVAAAPQGGSNAIYAQSTKATVRLNKKKKQQQQQQQQHAADANATYATPMRPVPEQDYVTLNEMPSNDEASVMYDVPTASAADAGAGAAVPKPTKVGGGTVLLGAASNHVDSDDGSDDFDC